jgi:hypothetical protein
VTILRLTGARIGAALPHALLDVAGDSHRRTPTTAHTFFVIVDLFPHRGWFLLRCATRPARSVGAPLVYGLPDPPTSTSA